MIDFLSEQRLEEIRNNYELIKVRVINPDPEDDYFIYSLRDKTNGSISGLSARMYSCIQYDPYVVDEIEITENDVDDTIPLSKSILKLLTTTEKLLYDDWINNFDIYSSLELSIVLGFDFTD